MEKLNFFFPPDQIKTLRGVSCAVGLPVAEVVRRMVDYCCQEKALNDLVPRMSGRFVVVLERLQ